MIWRVSVSVPAEHSQASSGEQHSPKDYLGILQVHLCTIKIRL